MAESVNGIRRHVRSSLVCQKEKKTEERKLNEAQLYVIFLYCHKPGGGTVGTKTLVITTIS